MTVNIHAIEMEWRHKNQGGPAYVPDPDGPKYDTEVDIVTVHRMALESINRLVLMKEPISIANISNGVVDIEVLEALEVEMLEGKTELPVSEKRLLGGLGKAVFDAEQAAIQADPAAVKALEKEKKAAEKTGNTIEVPVMKFHTTDIDPNVPIHVAKITTKPFIDFIDKTLSQFRDESDIITAGMKLLNDLSPYLGLDEFKEQVLDILCDTIQAYAPDPPPDRPRAPKRYLIKADEVLRLEQEAEDRRRAIEEAKERKERAR